MIVSSLVDYTIRKWQGGEFDKYLQKWQSLHSNDHQVFAEVLSSIGKSFNMHSLSVDAMRLHFDHTKLEEWNKFLFYNEQLHKILLSYYNELGLKIQVPTIMYPRFNVFKLFKSLDERTLNGFLFQEQRIHLLFARALNIMLERI